jgi:hypothetical protein
VEAPDVTNKSFVALDKARLGQVDKEGLPVVYDKDLIQKYWEKEGSALQQRWTEFLGYSVPYLTRVVGLLITGVKETKEIKTDASTYFVLSRAVRNFKTRLRPSFRLVSSG